jgi:hypothetical protein
MEGLSLRTICAADEMPDRATVFYWLRRNNEFYVQYARARDVQAEVWADEINDIADDSSNDYMTITVNGQEKEVVDHENIARARLRVDTRKWILSKVLPKKYGEKVQQEISGPDGVALKVEFVNGQS